MRTERQPASQTDRQTDRHDKANSSFSQFFECAKQCSIFQRQLWTMSLSRLGSFHANEHIEVSNLQSIFVLFLAYKNKLLQKFRNVLIIHYQSIMIVSVLYYTTDRRTCLSYNVSHLLLSLLVCELEFKLQAMNLIKSLTAPVDLHYTLKFSSYLRQNIGFNSHNYQQVNYIL